VHEAALRATIARTVAFEVLAQSMADDGGDAVAVLHGGARGEQLVSGDVGEGDAAVGVKQRDGGGHGGVFPSQVDGGVDRKKALTLQNSDCGDQSVHILAP
jgi:hypothetical protein